MAQFTITLDDDLLKALQNLARQQGLNVEELIVSILRDTLLPTNPVK